MDIVGVIGFLASIKELAPLLNLLKNLDYLLIFCQCLELQIKQMGKHLPGNIQVDKNKLIKDLREKKINNEKLLEIAVLPPTRVKLTKKSIIASLLNPQIVFGVDHFDQYRAEIVYDNSVSIFLEKVIKSLPVSDLPKLFMTLQESSEENNKENNKILIELKNSLEAINKKSTDQTCKTDNDSYYGLTEREKFWIKVLIGSAVVGTVIGTIFISSYEYASIDDFIDTEDQNLDDDFDENKIDLLVKSDLPKPIDGTFVTDEQIYEDVEDIEYSDSEVDDLDLWL